MILKEPPLMESRTPFLKALKSLSKAVPDRVYLQLRFMLKFRRFGDFRRPSTYNEKLQWMKLNYRVPGEWQLVDKFEVKCKVASEIGEEHVIPTLGVWDDIDEIDFSSLPTSFVLKCTHDSGGVMLVHDKQSVSIADVHAKLKYAMERNYFFSMREPHYKEIVPRIIAEPLLKDEKYGQLLDYKFFCFDGEVKAMFVASDRSTGYPKFDYFDADFTRIDVRQAYPNSYVPPEKPSQYEKMVGFCQVLSKGHPHVRIDFYEVDSKVYFGEFTFYHFGGMEPFHPSRWDTVFGSWLVLPSRQKPAALESARKSHNKR